MQTEDEKAKASGIAFAIVGLIASKFSILVAVLLGGGAVYAGIDTLHLVPPAFTALHGLQLATIFRLVCRLHSCQDLIDGKLRFGCCGKG